MPPSILFVDDDPDLRSLVCQIVRNAGMNAHCTSNAYEALDYWRNEYVDLILLDVMMPGMDGFDLCRNLRRISNIPIILLTAKGREADVVEGLTAGADDYIVKPFRPKELIARINTVLERTHRGQAQKDLVLRFQGILLNDESKQVFLHAEEVSISPTEFRLLQYLLKRQGKVCSKAELLQNVWGYVDSTGPLNLVEAAIGRLRKKIEPDPADPSYIHTVRGAGYRLGPR